jgi:hypothetical protein
MFDDKPFVVAHAFGDVGVAGPAGKLQRPPTRQAEH